MKAEIEDQAKGEGRKAKKACIECLELFQFLAFSL
jgi:hypothetical protein